MQKFPPPPEPPTASSNYLEELALYYQRLKEYGLKISKIADTQLGYVKALINPDFADLEGDLALADWGSAPTGSSTVIDKGDNPNQEFYRGVSPVALNLPDTPNETPQQRVLLDEQSSCYGTATSSPYHQLEQPLILLDAAPAVTTFVPTTVSLQTLPFEQYIEAASPTQENGSSTQVIEIPSSTEVVSPPLDDHEIDLENIEEAPPGKPNYNYIDEFTYDTQSLDDELSRTIAQVQLEEDDERLAVPASESDLLAVGEDVIEVTQQILSLLEARRGNVVQIDYIVRKLYGVIEEKELKQYLEQTRAILELGEKDKLWFKMPDSPGCWTIDLKEFSDLVESNSLVEISEDEEEDTEEFFPTSVVSDLLRYFCKFALGFGKARSVTNW